MAKIDWIRLRDENNSYFHASIKSKHKRNTIDQLWKDDGIILVTHEAIVKEVLNFFIASLWGLRTKELRG